MYIYGHNALWICCDMFECYQLRVDIFTASLNANIAHDQNQFTIKLALLRRTKTHRKNTYNMCNYNTGQFACTVNIYYIHYNGHKY